MPGWPATAPPLDAGGDPAVVARWIKQTQAQRAATEQEFQDTLRSARGSLDPSQLREIVEQAGGAIRTLATARPASKQRVYAELGRRLTYHPARQKVSVEARPLRGVYQSQCRRGRIQPYAYEAQHEAGGVGRNGPVPAPS
jgi:hypothetical protein